MNEPEIQNRLDRANTFIGVIASLGRQFFQYVHDDGPTVAELSHAFGQTRFFDEWHREWIDVSHAGNWPGFHHGGTLSGLISDLVEFINTGKQLRPAGFGDHWAYGGDIVGVIRSGQRLGVIELDPAARVPGGFFGIDKTMVADGYRPGHYVLNHGQAIRGPYVHPETAREVLTELVESDQFAPSGLSVTTIDRVAEFVSIDRVAE